jgi:hypothetical protein
MKRKAILRTEDLEHRVTPATSGVTWPDGVHLTISFAPDGTLVGTAKSNLFAELNPVASQVTWQREIVRAFQSWAVNSNINVAVVPDDGSPFGASGSVQGDPRFGDIRIGAVPLPAGTLATNTSFQWTGTTWSGDVLLNSNYVFSTASRTPSGAYDLFTVMLNEAGNVFGVVDTTTDTTSAVYDVYKGRKSGPNSNDITDIKSLYGVRGADALDAAAANNSITTSTTWKNASVDIEGDITTTKDVDFYKFTIPTTFSPIVGYTVKLTTAGVSSLQSTLSVYDAAQRAIGSGSATAPGQDLEVKVTKVAANQAFYVRVGGTTATSPVFGVGSYRLRVVFQYADGTTSDTLNTFMSSAMVAMGDMFAAALDPVNNSMAYASNLTYFGGIDARFDYAAKGSLYERTDVDFYKVIAPAGGALQTLNVICWGFGASGLAPRVDIYDASQQLVTSTSLIGNEIGTYSVQVPNTVAGAVYYVKVSALNPSGSRAVGGYFVGISFSSAPPVTMQSFASGMLASANNISVQTVTVGTNRLFQFNLGADAGPNGVGTEVRMQIVNADGSVIFSLSAYSGMPAVTSGIYLGAGTYTIRYTAIAPVGSALRSTVFTLTGREISEPIGPATSMTGTTKEKEGTDTWSGITTSGGTAIYIAPMY